ncbi:unnamed protein product [Cuscuta campestris]|uniref:Retrovirus-related Pol polyprotein from transposon TNT 1-94-like beta-barrel domain-containing protein n=1 Tax=Cuscuta campestris TaxID=132261 RepID=A0A484MQU3_9ASTE|nr:unnamed protein product [Cuscuta campestris]
MSNPSQTLTNEELQASNVALKAQVEYLAKQVVQLTKMKLRIADTPEESDEEQEIETHPTGDSNTNTGGSSHEKGTTDFKRLRRPLGSRGRAEGSPAAEPPRSHAVSDRASDVRSDHHRWVLPPLPRGSSPPFAYRLPHVGAAAEGAAVRSEPRRCRLRAVARSAAAELRSRLLSPRNRRCRRWFEEIVDPCSSRSDRAGASALRQLKSFEMAEDGKFRIEKFDGTDFSWWRMQIEDLLVQKDLDVVLGDKPEKMSDADWAGLDRKAMSMIRLSLTKNVAFNILKEKTAKGIMDALSNMYDKPFAANKVFLIRELVNTKMKEGTSVTEHINKLNSILARLLSVGIKFDDEVQALLLLSSLPDSWSGTVTAVTGSVSDEEVTLTCCEESNVDSWVMDSGASFHATHSGEALQNLVIRDFGKVRLADDRALDVTGMGDMVLKTSVGLWTLKDVRVIPALKKSLISVRQFDEQGHEVKFRDGQWKVVKGNLVMARGRKRGSLYTVEIPSEGVTVPVQKKNEIRFTESRGQNKDVPGSGSVRLQWEPVGTEDESGADFAVTDVLELGRASTGLSVV